MGLVCGRNRRQIYQTSDRREAVPSTVIWNREDVMLDRQRVLSSGFRSRTALFLSISLLSCAPRLVRSGVRRRNANNSRACQGGRHGSRAPSIATSPVFHVFSPLPAKNGTGLRTIRSTVLASSKRGKGSVRFLSDEERERLLAETVKDPQLHTFSVLALATASRAGELWNLKWCDVDLKDGRLLLRETEHAEPRTAWVRGEALRLLAEYGKVRRLNDDPVFVSVTGKQYRYAKPFSAACEAAGVRNFTSMGFGTARRLTLRARGRRSSS
jgi:integrase